MSIQKASPADLRKAKEMCDALIRAGIDFVPVVVTSEEDRKDLLDKSIGRLFIMERKAKSAEAAGGTV